MSHVVESSRAHRLVWAFSILLGIGLSLYTSDLRSGRVANSPRPRPIEQEQSCLIPAHALTPQVAVIARDIARRFHVARDSAVSITRAAFSAARASGIDPTLVLAVAAIESKFKSKATNPVTGAKGLMQVMPRWHQDKLAGQGGEPALSLISPNVNIGAAILADYLDAENGNVEAALGRYLGTSGGVHYVQKVRQEMVHFNRVLEAT
jgi:soluble lytic murein transglycosylase-like protein